MELRVKPLAPNKSLLASSLFVCVFQQQWRLSLLLAYFTVLSVHPPSPPPPPHHLPNRGKVHHATVTRTHRTQRIRKLKEREARAILSLTLPWCNQCAHLRYLYDIYFLGQNVKSTIFPALFSFRIHRSRYTAWRYHLRCWNPKVYNSRSKFPQCHNLPTWLVAEKHSPLHYRQKHWWVFPERLQPTSSNRCDTKSLWLLLDLRV